MLDDTQQAWLVQVRRKLFGYSCALCPDISGAEDLYQDTVLRAMTAPSVPGDFISYRVWLFRIMRNLWIDRLRAQGRLPEFDTSADIDEMPNAYADDQVVNALAVRQAFGALSKPHRDILALVDICGFSYAEAAEMLDVPAGTIMSRVSRARAALVGRMEEERNVISLPLRRMSRKAGDAG
ncbi:MAG: RNA polymerase sigma factor [Roseinatronobacter sp.]|jgi:RNA polymerase sigma-70 factor (ECF subfamily)|nr:RNA polymerase sigma factor [Roseinatronobacter sp.]